MAVNPDIRKKQSKTPQMTREKRKKRYSPRLKKSRELKQILTLTCRHSGRLRDWCRWVNSPVLCVIQKQTAKDAGWGLIMSAGRLDHLTLGPVDLWPNWAIPAHSLSCWFLSLKSSFGPPATAPLFPLSLPWHQKMLNFLAGLCPRLRPPRSHTAFSKGKWC